MAEARFDAVSPRFDDRREVISFHDRYGQARFYPSVCRLICRSLDYSRERGAIEPLRDTDNREEQTVDSTDTLGLAISGEKVDTRARACS